MAERLECDVKGQAVRLVDVFVLGPFMIWFAARAHGMPASARVALAVGGATTIVFNGVNYMRLRDAR